MKLTLSYLVEHIHLFLAIIFYNRVSIFRGIFDQILELFTGKYVQTLNKLVTWYAPIIEMIHMNTICWYVIYNYKLKISGFIMIGLFCNIQTSEIAVCD